MQSILTLSARWGSRHLSSTFSWPWCGAKGQDAGSLGPSGRIRQVCGAAKANMSLRQYCTYFDRNYLLKGLALHRSLCDVAGDFMLWVLCLDQETQDILAQLAAPRIRIVPLRELEDWEPRLPAVRSDRTLVEYYWTSTPTWIAYVMSHVAEGQVVSYVDADLYFFGSPEPIEVEVGAAAVIIHAHRYASRHQDMVRASGIYNVGLTAFRVSLPGWQAVRWWQAACLEACYLRPEQGMCGDQKYLDDWPERFTGVHVLQHLGAGLAPW